MNYDNWSLGIFFFHIQLATPHPLFRQSPFFTIIVFPLVSWLFFRLAAFILQSHQQWPNPLCHLLFCQLIKENTPKKKESDRSKLCCDLLSHKWLYPSHSVLTISLHFLIFTNKQNNRGHIYIKISTK